MKYLFCLFLPLIGCASNAQMSNNPTGEEVISALLEVSDLELSTEPLCNVESVSLIKKPYLLMHHLSAILATSYESKNSIQVQTSCSSSMHEKSNGSLIEVWDCQLITNELSPSGEFITASTIAFGLEKPNLKYVPLSLRCF